MQLDGESRAILADMARQLGVAAPALAAAVEHEDFPELARLMRIGEAEVAVHLAPLRRITTVGDDWGAGCRLLTDELRAEFHAALRGLLPVADHVSSGGSHG